MRFGPLPLAQAEGATLAHSLALPDGARLRKGRVLSAADLARLSRAGIAEVIAARLGPDDIAEDAAAARIAAALAPEPEALGLSVSAPFTGRVNLFAARAGVVEVDAARVDALNALDEAVTLATLGRYERVAPRQMVATVKIIPYAAPAAAVARAEAIARAHPLLRVHGLARASAGLILTRVPGMAEKVVEKGAQAVRGRLAALGIALAAERVVPHESSAIAAALAAMPGGMLLILTGSATSDRADAGPGGLIAAGGRLARFGMPVDPGNLLFLGDIGGRPVIGLPGCARSPRLNGADWVLERLACGIEVDAGAIAGMGVGGLLKEIPSRPSPRAGAEEAGGARRPVVSAILLAAGAARRMGGRDKLMEDIGGRPLLARSAAVLAASGVDEVVAVLRPDDGPRAAALAGIPGLRLVENPRAAEGMGSSIAAGMGAIRADAGAVLIAMADMPDLAAPDVARVIAAFDPGEGRAIVRATAEDGTPGHPVLFGRRFFEALRGLGGDEGARALVREHADYAVEVALPGRAALTDLDTPGDWARWRALAAAPAGAPARDD